MKTPHPILNPISPKQRVFKLIYSDSKNVTILGELIEFN